MATNVPPVASDVGYLLDRLTISDLLISFAHAIDTKNWTAYEDLLAEDGIVEIPVKLPDGSYLRHVGREGTADWVAGNSEKPGLSQFAATHHMSTNHQVNIEGDSASTHSYTHCIHRLSDNPGEVWEVGGWYTCDLRRVGDRDWKFAKVHFDIVWEHGKPVWAKH
ncbi:hypothetical protein Purlil1_382 [Purpureocillium lilacinum]|uniref:SnoaL-like domain-containing protein n=1 Tax=Purpureocillium lilacinum TaxID=33203 RepID=A0ABR0CIA3_PURLI|nr:hypothetical protein Purlil1_382 [Purpureocillium lilacinum]